MNDHLASMYAVVRDATICNTAVSNAEKVAVLELVKAELVSAMQADITGAPQ